MNNNCRKRESLKKWGGGGDKRKIEETEEKYIKTKARRVETNCFTDRMQVREKKHNNCVKISEREFWN